MRGPTAMLIYRAIFAPMSQKGQQRRSCSIANMAALHSTPEEPWCWSHVKLALEGRGDLAQLDAGTQEIEALGGEVGGDEAAVLRAVRRQEGGELGADLHAGDERLPLGLELLQGED